jgi:hypothetical protein
MAELPSAITDARPHGLQLPAASSEEPMIAVRMPRRSKYGAKAVVIDGIRFASKKEGKRYAELKLLAKAGEIRVLQIQPRFTFEVRSVKMFTYIADFSYFRNRKLVIEDVKGVRTPLYKLKKKIIEHEYNTEITEV